MRSLSFILSAGMMAPTSLPASVAAIVLVAALLHASWNALLKAAPDVRIATVLVLACSSTIAAALLPWVPLPGRASWPCLAASAVLQIAYYRLLAATYRSGDMSQAYPLMRGTAPLLVAAASGPLLGERLSGGEWMGVALIGAGAAGLMLGARRGGSGRSAMFAVVNAVIIAGYTLVDGAGVRLSGAPLSYILWTNALPGLPLTAWTIWREGPALRRGLRGNLPVGMASGAGALGSYGLVLWSMTMAPVALVAALRETSILFATAIAMVILKERVTRTRLAMTLIIAAGAAVLRLA